jgi:rod shape-determining protein MreD
MWLKLSITLLFFYVFAVAQTSFFLHFNIWGIGPDFIFILFFILIFFSAADKKNLSWENLLYSVVAGFFLDISSYSYFGISIFLLIVIVFLCNKALQSLNKRKDQYPIIYFLPLFTMFYIFYKVFHCIIFYLFNFSQFAFNLNWILIMQIILNLFFAILGFYTYRFLVNNIRKDNSRQFL